MTMNAFAHKMIINKRKICEAQPPIQPTKTIPYRCIRLRVFVCVRYACKNMARFFLHTARTKLQMT